MIEWWGPIICEYYGATEAFGFAYCDTKEWLDHPGTVGKIMIGELTVMDDEMNEMPVGEPVLFGLNLHQNLTIIRSLKKLQKPIPQTKA